MNSTKLVKLLRSLDKDEFRRFKKFLQSPYHNFNPLIVKLYEALKPFYPEFDSPKMTNEKIFRRLFAGNKYHDGRMRNLISDLKILTEEYLVDLELRSNKFEKKKILNKSFSRRNLFSFYAKTTTQLVNELEALPFKDIHIYNEVMWLKHDYFFHPLTDKYKSTAYEIEDVMEEMDRFFILGKLQFGSEIKNRERIFSKKNSMRFVDICLGETHVLEKENSIFKLYKNVYDLHNPEKMEHAYINIKKLLTQYLDQISKDDSVNILLNLRNYIIRKINSGQIEYFKELFELYKLGIEHQLIFDNNTIKEGDFTNIIHAGCMQKEFDWTEAFVNKYDKYLDENVREDARMLGMAILYFHNKNYEEALSNLNQHHFKNPLYQVQTKTFLIRLWFEQFYEDHDYYDFLLDQLHAFEKVIRRNTSLSILKKEENLNLVLAIRNLANYIYQKKNIEETKVKMNPFLSGDKRLIARKWLESKVALIK